jgi:hypothetical protein
MADHTKQSDPKGVNPTGNGPAQPKDTDEAGKRTDTNSPARKPQIPGGQAEADEYSLDHQAGIGWASDLAQGPLLNSDNGRIGRAELRSRSSKLS